VPIATVAPTPSVAFCISGGARSLSFVAKSLFHNVVEAVQPDPTRRAIIFNLQTTSDCNANPENVRTPGKMQACESMLAASASFVSNGNLSALFRSASVRIDNNFDCNHPFAVNQSACCKKRFTALNPPSGGGFWSYAQYLRRRLCISSIRAMEVERNATFDYIVLVRPDLYFCEPLPPVTYLTRRKAQVLASSKEQNQPPGDYIYLLPRELMDPFDGALYDDFDGYCANNRLQDLGAPPEFRLMEWIIRRAVPFQVFPFKFVVVRSTAVADCFRLSNEVLHVSRESTEHGLMSMREQCDQAVPAVSQFLMAANCARLSVIVEPTECDGQKQVDCARTQFGGTVRSVAFDAWCLTRCRVGVVNGDHTQPSASSVCKRSIAGGAFVSNASIWWRRNPANFDCT
jgi:hypothetical protein